MSEPAASITVHVNGEPREVAPGSTVQGLVEALGLRGPVAVERNAVLVPRAQHASAMLGPGDVLEIVHFVGGG